MDLTSEFLKEHYLNAYFVDNERTQIAVLYTDPTSDNPDKVVETVLSTKWNTHGVKRYLLVA